MKRTTLLIMFGIASCFIYANEQVTLIKKNVIQNDGMRNPFPLFMVTTQSGFLYCEASCYCGLLHVLITDTNGCQIYHQTEYCEGCDKWTIDTRNFSEGKYVLNIMLDNGSLYYGTFKI